MRGESPAVEYPDCSVGLGRVCHRADNGEEGRFVEATAARHDLVVGHIADDAKFVLLRVRQARACHQRAGRPPSH